MLYQNYLLLLQLITEIEKKKKILENEIIKYNNEIRKNHNYKMIYYTETRIS